MEIIPTGAEIAARSGRPVVIGTVNEYDWTKGVITLRADVYAGREPIHLLIAAHELRHSQQPKWINYAMIITWKWPHLNPMYHWREADAWAFAAQFLADTRTAKRT